MTDDGSITRRLKQLLDGDEEAAHRIWDEYFERLVRLAKRNLSELPLRDADEEDVALSAMHSFVRGAAGGRFKDLKNRGELWKLLVTITLRKVSKQHKRLGAKKRGAMNVLGEADLLEEGDDSDNVAGLDRFEDKNPPPPLVVEAMETCRELLNRLADDSLRSIARFRLEGFSNAEIAEKLDIVERTVERKLNRIRTKWSAESVDG